MMDKKYENVRKQVAASCLLFGYGMVPVHKVAAAGGSASVDQKSIIVEQTAGEKFPKARVHKSINHRDNMIKSLSSGEPIQ